MPRLAAPALAQGAKIRVGYVSPQSGPLAAFAEADAFVVKQFLATEAGANFEILIRDSQSNPNRAAEVTRELIIDEEVSLIIVASTPETTNPVSSTCELEGVPCISTVAPWQPWFIGQQGNPGAPDSWTEFESVFHYFWGLEDVIANFTAMWAQLDTNKSVGALFPNDGDGNAWGNPELGFPPVLAEQGYSLTDTGRFQPLTDDFSAQIAAFRAAQTEIVTGVVIPPDLTTFWTQARQQGFAPKVMSVGKALLFPQAVETLGAAGHNLSTEVWWTPSHPFTSSLTGENAQAFADAFTASTGRPWTQPIGYTYSLFELAADVMGRADDAADPQSVIDAITATALDTLVGRIAWDGQGVPDFAARNVAKTGLVGGQWRRDADGKFELVVVENATMPDVPLGGAMEAIS